mgnify:CR=1 FL=1
MNFIKQILEVQETKLDLIAMLQERLTKTEEPRPFSDLRASMLTGEVEFCPREVALADITGASPKPKYIPAALRATFDVGLATEQTVVEKWLYDVAVGHWECMRCGFTTDFTKRPMKCVACGGSWFFYRQVGFRGVQDIGWLVDLIVDFNVGKHMAIELKIIAPDMFADLKAPLAEHRVRTNLYLHLIRTSTSPVKERMNLDRAKILYISRGHGKKHGTKGVVLPFLEFDVKYEPQSLKPYLEKAQAVKIYRDTKKIPKGVCATSFVGRVKSCGVVKSCWSGKYRLMQ